MSTTITFEVTVTIDTFGPIDEVRAGMTKRVEQALFERRIAAEVEDIGVDYPDGSSRTALERAAHDLLDVARAFVKTIAAVYGDDPKHVPAQFRDEYIAANRAIKKAERRK